MVRVQHECFDPAEEMRQLRAGLKDCGAQVSFVGYVRDINAGEAVNALYLECYPEMAQKTLEDLVRHSQVRWGVRAVRLIHRYGHLDVEEPIVFVGVMAAHRDAAFEACRFLIDTLKQDAPFWKKEYTPEGPRWLS